MARIGVFICHCGENISATVDVQKVAEAAARMPGVVHSVDYKYMCSDPGQKMIKDAIKEKKLTGVVVAACSPRMHEPTFRRACAEAGLNPFLCEMANIREHCSWVHEKGDATTDKAIDLVRILVEKVKKNKAAAAHQGAGDQDGAGDRRRHRRHPGRLDIANCRPQGDPGREGALHRRPHGPALRDVPDAGLLAVHPDAAHGRGGPAPEHHALHLLRAGEPRRLHRQLQGDASARRRAAWTKSSAPAAACARQKCPTKKIPSEFDAGLGMRTAIYVPFPQAVPNKPVIDREHCTYYLKGKCRLCEKVCPTKAIRFDQEDEIVEVEVGAVVAGHRLRRQARRFLPRIRLRQVQGRHRRPAVRAAGLRLRARPWARSSGPRTARCRKRSSSSPAPARATRPRASSTAPRSAACTRPSTPCSTSTRCTTARPTSSTWTSAPAARCTRSSCAGPSRRTTCNTSAAASRASTSEDGKLIVKGADTLLGARPVEIEADMVVLATAGVAQRRRRGAGPEAACQLRRLPLLRRSPSQAAAGGDQHRRHLPGRRLPGAQGHPRDGGPGLRRRGQGRRRCSRRPSWRASR